MNQSSGISDYADIKEALKEFLNDEFDALFIELGDYYVNFLHYVDPIQPLLVDDGLTFEAASHINLPSLGNKDKEFEQLGFAAASLAAGENSNYHKWIHDNNFSIEQTVAEIQIIFELIYKINFSNYKIEKFS